MLETRVRNNGSLSGAVLVGGPVIGGTSGSVLFVDSSGNLAQDNANLFWDDANNRLGIGTVTPQTALSLPVSSTGISLYNTADMTTNYEQGLLSWAANVFKLASSKGGSGTARNINISTPVTTLILKGVAGSGPVIDYDVNSSSAANYTAIRLTTGTMSTATSGTYKNVLLAPGIIPGAAGSGSYHILDLSYTLNGTAGAQTGTGTGIFLNATETTLNGMAHNLIDLQVGTVTQFLITNAGKVGIGTASPAQLLDISSTAPSFQMTDITASAKSLRLVVDANIANFYEAAGAAGDILSLDLANKRVGIGTIAPAVNLHGKTSGGHIWRLENTDGSGATTEALQFANDNGVQAGITATRNTSNLQITSSSGTLWLGALNNLKLGGSTASWGTSAQGVFNIASGVAPTTSPTDVIQMWSADREGTAGKASLHIRTEDGTSHVFGDFVGIGTVIPTQDLSFSGQAARTIWMERHTTSNTAGNSLTVQAGGATVAATDKNGGALILSPGASTGTGIVSVNIKGYTQGTTGTSDNTQIDRQIVGNVKTLTNNSNTAMVNCTIANGTVIAGVLRYAVEVTDGTDYQVEEGMISYHVTNKAGVLANNTVVKFGNQQAMTAGTLTVTWTITAANPAVLTLNANSSLTPSAGYPKVTYTIDNLTSQAISIV